MGRVFKCIAKGGSTLFGKFLTFLTNFVLQIGEKTEKNSDKILLAYHFYGSSLFLNIKVFIILSTSKKFYILPKWS